jgi:dienelactone hydrolase
VFVQLTFESGAQQIVMDVFGADSRVQRPAILVLHGSGGMWNPMYHTYAEQFARFGFAVFVPHYFARTATTWADDATIHRHFREWLDVCTGALDVVSQHPGVDTERVGVLGFSLGGFLSLALAAQDERVKAVVEFFGGMPEELANGCKRMPPVLILHGDADERVPVRWAHEVEQLLQRCGTEHEMKIYRGAGHIFNMPTMLDAGQRTVRFLRKYLEKRERRAV